LPLSRLRNLFNQLVSPLSLSLSFFYPLSFKIGLNTCANTKESLLSLPLSCITHSKFIQLILSQATTQCIQQIQPCTHSFYSLSLSLTHTHTLPPSRNRLRVSHSHKNYKRAFSNSTHIHTHSHTLPNLRAHPDRLSLFLRRTLSCSKTNFCLLGSQILESVTIRILLALQFI